MEGVVFLDDADRKMILVRATGRVLKVAECGIPKLKRFAFYDQVHTTGMDIDHTPNAQAVQSLGKDMTFRDYSQGAYRMRGIGQGQTVHLLIIPEVYDLIKRSVECIRPPEKANVLVDVTAWLLVNSIRSEHTQHNQLWHPDHLQRVAQDRVPHSPRCRGGRQLREVGRPRPCRHCFCAEPFSARRLDYSVAKHVPQPRLFSEAIAEYVSANSTFITTEEARRVVDGVVAMTQREDEIDNPTIDVQMVQEQEEEREAEAEREKEQQIEMEKVCGPCLLAR